MRSTSLRTSKALLSRWGTAPVLGAVLLCAAQAEHLGELATLHGAAGYEEQVRQYIESQLGQDAEVDNTGSITKTFGRGLPRTLIAAGLDEPGFVISAIADDGYLRLKRLAEPAPHYQFESLLQSQHVTIQTRAGKNLMGVVAAPSVHLDDERGPSSSRTDKDLYVDIGASTAAEARSAGVEVLDPVTLDKRLIRFPGGRRISAPWIASRAGAASLLRLAERFSDEPPEGTVTLAFVTQQFYYNTGLLRVLQRSAADRVIWLAPGGKSSSQIAPASGWSSELQDELWRLASDHDLDFQQASSFSKTFGPFRMEEPWPDAEQAAVLSVGVEHAGTPIETIHLSEVEKTARLLAASVGITWGEKEYEPIRRGKAQVNRPAGVDSLSSLIRQLAGLPGVSGAESAVRDWIRKSLPDWAKHQTRTDEHGNLIVPLGTEGPPAAIFVAHMDEIGFRVKGIGPDGVLSVESLGGLNASLFEWRPVIVHTSQGPLDACMTMRGAVDAGIHSADEAESLGITAGDTVTVPRRWSRLLGQRIAASALDDRVGCGILLRTLQSLSAAEVRKLGKARPTWIVFSSKEEIGLVGAEALAKENSPRRVYPVDSFVTSDSPMENQALAQAPLGRGFVIRALDTSGISNRAEVERVASLARSHGIPIQYGVTSGGNDGSRFIPYGAVNIPLSWPLRYSHTGGEVSDLQDIEALGKIVDLLLREELFRR